jgi:hypothetical protein
VFFHLPDERVISITGSKFVELTDAGGVGQMKSRLSGGGAIDLVMFVTGWDLPAARRWLALNFGIQNALATEYERVEQVLRPELEVQPTAVERKTF